jgi:hypothetical protein
MNKSVQDYAGVIHVHTRHSDGSGTVPEVIQFAQKAELDYLIITDHNHMKAKKYGAEGWHGNDSLSLPLLTKRGMGGVNRGNRGEVKGHRILVLVGVEITKREGDCLALNVDSVGLARRKAHEYIPLVQRQGGLTFLCHPHFGSKPQFRISDSSWKRWDIFQDSEDVRNSAWPTGIELWNHLGDWAEDLSWGTFLSHIQSPDKYIEGPNKTTLKTWDELTQKHPLVAFGGADAHAKTVLPFGYGVTVTYLESFRGVRTHILCDPFTGDWKKDAEKVYHALGQGHCYISYDSLANAKGFSFEAFDEHHQLLALMGDTLKHDKKIILKSHSPQPHSKIRLIHNGTLIHEYNQSTIEYSVTNPGVYRIEIYLKNRSWLFSNPIYLQ